MADGLDTADRIAASLDEAGNIVILADPWPAARLGLSIRSVNRSFVAALGHAPETVRGMPLDLVLDPHADAAVVAAIRAAVEAGRSLQVELLCRDTAGQPHWLGLHVMAPASGSGFVVMGRDITAKRREREEQRRMQHLLASVFILVDAAVAIVDEAGIIRMANPPLAELLGVAPERLVGRAATDFVHPDDQLKVREGHRRHQRLDVRLKRPDGSTIAGCVVTAATDKGDVHRFRVVTFHAAPDQQTAPARQPAPAGAALPDAAQCAGKLRLIGLDAVRESLGDRWPALAERAMQTAESVLRRRLDAHELFARTADHGFIIRFASGTEAEISFRASTIANEIRMKLIGQGDEASAAVSAITATLPHQADDPRDPAALMDVLDRRLTALRGKIEQQAQEILHDAADFAVCVIETVIAPDSGRVLPLRYASLPEALDHQLSAAIAVLPDAALGTLDPAALMLTLAAERAAEAPLSGPPTLLLTPIPFELFLNRRRSERFLGLCRGLEPAIRQRLAFMIGGVPHGVAQSRVGTVIRLIKPFCAFVGIELDDFRAPPFDLAEQPITVVALPARALTAPGAADGDALARFVALLRRNRIRLLARHPSDPAQAAGLGQLGADMVSWPEPPQPRH